MKKRNPIILSVITLFLALSWACETDITVDLPEPDELLIVEGYIENDAHPYIFLSKNSGYFDPVELPEFPETFDPAELDTYINMMKESMGIIWDSSAVVTVSDGELTDTMIPGFSPIFPFLCYQAPELKGEINKSYTLEIDYKGSSYAADTYIPDTIPIDSIWFRFLEDNDSLGNLGFFALDPINTTNYYSVKLKTIGEHDAYYAPYFGRFVFDDYGLTSDTLRYAPLTKAYNGNDFFEDTNAEDDSDFLSEAFHEFGSTVSIKFSTLDIEHYYFWMSYFKHMGTAGNPFTNPASLQGNIEGENCEGIWGGFGSVVRTVTIDSSLVRE